MTAAEIRTMLKRACESAGTAKAWAEKNDISPTYVSDVIHGRRDPGHAICEALGVVPETTYRKTRK